MSTKKVTAEALVEYYHSIGIEAHVCDPNSIEDLNAAALGVDPKLADAVYGTKSAKAASRDDAKAKAKPASKDGGKKRAPKHAKKGSAEAREQMAKLRAQRAAKSKRKQQESSDEATTDESKDADQ